MRAFLSEERNVLRIRAAEPFGECGGPEREWGGGGEGREGFRRHYRGHCPPEIIKLKSNYGLIIVNPPPIPKSFLCSKLGWNRGGGGWRDVCDDWGEDCWTNDEFLGMFGWIVRSEEFIDTTRHDYGGPLRGGGARNSSPWMLLSSCGDFAACDRFWSRIGEPGFPGRTLGENGLDS